MTKIFCFTQTNITVCYNPQQYDTLNTNIKLGWIWYSRCHCL